MKLKYLDSAANLASGKILYVANCQKCHGKEGEGVENDELTGYVFPPLWGKKVTMTEQGYSGSAISLPS